MVRTNGARQVKIDNLKGKADVGIVIDRRMKTRVLGNVHETFDNHRVQSLCLSCGSKVVDVPVDTPCPLPLHSWLGCH